MDKRKSNKFGTMKGIAWLTLSTVILKIIGVIYKVPISHILGDEGMGYFNSAYTVYTLFYILCTSGIPKGISIIISKYEAEHHSSSDSFYKATMLILGAIGIFLTFLFILFAPLFTKIISSNNSLIPMYAVAPSVLFVCMNGVARGYLTGKMKFSHIAISEVIIGALKLVVGLLLAIIGMKLLLPTPIICALAILGITVGTLVSTVYLASVCGINTSGTPIKISRNEIVNLIKISFPITFASVGTGLIAVFDLFLIMRGLAENGYSEGVANALYGNYSTLTLPMISLVSTLISPIVTAYAPTLARKYAKGEYKEYLEYINESLSLVSFITIPCFCVFLIYPDKLLGIIFENGSVILGFTMLSVIAPGVLLLGATTVINNAIEVTGRVKIPVISISVGAFVKMIITIILMKHTDLGILSAPLGTLISYTVSLIISYLGFKMMFKYNLGIYKSATLPLFSSATALLFSMLFSELLAKLGESIIQSIIILSIFAFTYLANMLILSKKSRKLFAKIRKINKIV